jgi:hypothetical protein
MGFGDDCAADIHDRTGDRPFVNLAEGGLALN